MAEPIRIAILKETEEGERRVAATPETVGKFIKLGAEVAVEQGAGDGARMSDAAYAEAGAKVLTGPQALDGAEIVLAVRAPDPVVLAGAKLNAEIEHQTAVDTTVGEPEPIGERGAIVADSVGAKRGSPAALNFTLKHAEAISDRLLRRRNRKRARKS